MPKSKRKPRKISMTSKQYAYVQAYIISKDPIQSYVKAGYVSTIEEAKASKNYTQPLKTKAIRLYFQSLTINQSPKLTEHNLKNDIVDKNYDDDSPIGMNVSRFLKDVIYCSKYPLKDRLKALEMLLKFKGNESQEIPQIFNVFKSELNTLQNGIHHK